MLGLILFAVATAFVSALHGGDHATKGVAITIHAAVAVLCSPLAVASVILYWGSFRRGRQAQAELQYMAGRVGIDAVRKAYILGVGYVVAPAIRFATKNPFLDLPSRRRQEVLGGFVLGLLCYSPIFMVGLLK